jgi:hypothetical protein
MSDEAIGKALARSKSGAAWTARCPAHEDRECGRSLAEADDGKVPARLHGQHQGVAAPTVARSGDRKSDDVAFLCTKCGTP